MYRSLLIDSREPATEVDTRKLLGNAGHAGPLDRPGLPALPRRHRAR